MIRLTHNPDSPIRWPACAALLIACILSLGQAHGQTRSPGLEFTRDGQLPSLEEMSEQVEPANVEDVFNGGPSEWFSAQGLSSTIKVMLLMTVLSLAPAILLMTTSFVRIIVVLGLLRQALGTQQLPPSQVITSIAMFLSLLIMTPVWTDVYNEAIQPYTEAGMDWKEAIDKAVVPIKRFMSRQIDIAGNRDDIWLFYEYLPEQERANLPEYYEDVPMKVMLPAFMLSELKVAFMIGFQIYLPFLILDIVVASVTISMGMLMLPPVMISLPFKLMLFVLVDGWNLVVGMLLESFAPYT